MIMRTLCIFCLALPPAALEAASITPCTSSFQYSCAQATTGGYYVLTPFPSTGSTEITAYTTGGTQAFDVTIPSPPNGPGSGALASQISYAQTQVAIQSGILTPAQAAGAGGSTIVTALDLLNFAARDTAQTQNLTQYSTTVNVDLNGAPVSSHTFSAAFNSQTAQSAILAADSLLFLAGATPGTPALISSSNVLTGSQTSYLETGWGEGDGYSAITSSDTFGPAYVPINCGDLSAIGSPTPPGTCQDASIVGSVPFYVPHGQLDINEITTIGVYIDRSVTTTNNYLLSQTYEIDGFTPSAAPEPASLGLAGAGLAALAIAVSRKRRI